MAAGGRGVESAIPNQSNEPKEPVMKITSNDNANVAIYGTHTEAEAAVKELQHSGFDMRKLSIVARDFQSDEHVVGYYNTGERMQSWGVTGAFWGGLWGMLYGSAFFLVPGVGPFLVAGPLVGWIVGALEGAAVVGGMSVIGAAMWSLGIPEDSILRYETDLGTGKFVVVAHGTSAETVRAREIINRTNPEQYVEHVLCPRGEAQLAGV